MLRQKINITQQDGKITVSDNNGVVTIYDMNRVIEGIENGNIDDVYLANMVAEIMHDCLNADRMSCKLHDCNDRHQYSSSGTAIESISAKSNYLKSAMKNICEKLLDKYTSIYGISDADALATVFEDEGFFDSDKMKNGNEVVIFNDKIDCELPSIAFDITEWVFIDYNEYKNTLEENNKDITDNI